MNILYINHYAGTPTLGMEFRPYYFGQEWQKQGHNVCILAAGYSHVRSTQPTLLPLKKTHQNIDGLDYIWYPTPEYRGNGLPRVKNIFSFLKQIWFDINNIINDFKPHIVIASSTYPLDIWVAKRIAKRAKAKLIYEVHDLWPLSPIELGGMSPLHPFIQLCQKAENTAYKHSDAVVSMLPNVHEHMSQHGLDLSKLHIIPNGIVVDDWKNKALPLPSELETLLNKEKGKGHRIVCYAGAHGKPNALDVLLDTAALLKDQPISFLLIGTGLEKAALIEKSKALDLNNILFHNPITKTQIPTLLDNIDIAYIGLQKQSLFRFGISPNKLMDYMMAAKPIICSIDAGNDPVSEANCGITVKSGKPNDIANSIRTLSQKNDETLLEIGLRGQKYVLEKHTYEVLANNFLKAMQ